MTRVLVVDDMQFEIQNLRQMLVASGFAVDTATNGREALAAVEREAPDCILSDVMMPVMDGLELLDALRCDGHDIPTIMLTANCQGQTRDDCLELGARDVLGKPIDREWLIRTIRRVLQQRYGATG